MHANLDPSTLPSSIDARCKFAHALLTSDMDAAEALLGEALQLAFEVGFVEPSARSNPLLESHPMLREAWIDGQCDAAGLFDI